MIRQESKPAGEMRTQNACIRIETEYLTEHQIINTQNELYCEWKAKTKASITTLQVTRVPLLICSVKQLQHYFHKCLQTSNHNLGYR